MSCRARGLDWRKERTKIQRFITLVDCENFFKTEESNNKHFWRILYSTVLHQKGAKSSLFIGGDISSGFQAKFKPRSSPEQFLSSTLYKRKLRFHQQLNQYNGVVTPHRRKLAASSSPSSLQLCRPTHLWLWQTLSWPYKKNHQLGKKLFTFLNTYFKHCIF